MSQHFSRKELERQFQAAREQDRRDFWWMVVLATLAAIVVLATFASSCGCARYPTTRLQREWELLPRPVESLSAYNLATGALGPRWSRVRRIQMDRGVTFIELRPSPNWRPWQPIAEAVIPAGAVIIHRPALFGGLARNEELRHVEDWLLHRRFWDDSDATLDVLTLGIESLRRLPPWYPWADFREVRGKALGLLGAPDLACPAAADRHQEILHHAARQQSGESRGVRFEKARRRLLGKGRSK
jgi:hypothetical protein